MGDPIKLNGGGGILGLAASLAGTLAAGGFSLGTLGASLAGFGDIGKALGGLSGILGQSGMGSLLSSLPISGIGSALEVIWPCPYWVSCSTAWAFLESPTSRAAL